jgi:hypothetical protein
VLALLLVVLLLVGLLIGSIYLGLIARWVSGAKSGLSVWLRSILINWARLLALVLTVGMTAFFLAVPFLLAVEILAMLIPPLAGLLLLAGIGFAIWGLFHLFFSPHGILFRGSGVRAAIRSSVAVVRQNRLASAGLIFVVTLISLGLTILWSIPPYESWWRLIAIVGSAFVNTGLVAATFVFYRDRIDVQPTTP